MPGKKTKSEKLRTKNYIGLALDLGTTVIKGCAIDLKQEKIIGKTKTYNLQNEFGSDVLIRISNALQGKYEILRSLLLQSIDKIKDELKVKSPDFIVVVGNTAMLSFYQNKSVAGLARFPFKSELHTEKIKITGKTFMFPIIGSFVGGDTIAGILASQLFSQTPNHQSLTPALYIDLGTNGEVALITKGKIFAASTAAGPAFEGVGISCGSLAIPGAIERVRYNKGRFIAQTINKAEPVGICASGIIDMLALMLKHKFVDSSGKLIKSLNIAGFSLNQADIRKLQLAISAIHAGVKILINKANIKTKNIDEIVITGEFGANLNTKALKEIGIIPSNIKKIRFDNDLPLKGAIVMLKNKNIIKQIKMQASTSN